MADPEKVCPVCSWVALSRDDNFCNGCGRRRGTPRAVAVTAPLVSPRAADVGLLVLLTVVVPVLLFAFTR